MQNILSFEGRIDNYEELMEIISKIIKYLEQSENEDLKLLSEKIKFLSENYELNGQKFHNKIIQEIFGINHEELEGENNDMINKIKHNEK